MRRGHYTEFNLVSKLFLFKKGWTFLLIIQLVFTCISCEPCKPQSTHVHKQNLPKTWSTPEIFNYNAYIAGLRSRHEVRSLHSRRSIREHPDVAAAERQVGVHVQGQGGIERSKTRPSPQASKGMGLKLDCWQIMIVLIVENNKGMRRNQPCAHLGENSLLIIKAGRQELEKKVFTILKFLIHQKNLFHHF